MHDKFSRRIEQALERSPPGGGNPAGSGRGGPVVDDTDDLINGERDDAEHEMAFDLECAADAEKSGDELVFQAGVDAFGHGAEIVDQVVEVGHVDEVQALDLAAPFGRRWAWPSAWLWSWIAAASPTVAFS